MDGISQNYIEQASSQLISKRRGKWNYLTGTFGGIFFGATVSNIFRNDGFLSDFFFNRHLHYSNYSNSWSIFDCNEFK